MTELEKTIYELEMSLLKPEVRLSSEQLNLLLADDFMEFGSAGLIYKKKDTIETLINSSDKTEFLVTDFNAKELAEGVVLATFKTERAVNDTDKVASLRSSLWKKNGSQWQMVFHQGTPIKQ